MDLRTCRRCSKVIHVYILRLGAQLPTKVYHEEPDSLLSHLRGFPVLKGLLRLVSIIQCHQAVSASDGHEPAQLSCPVRAGYRHTVHQWRVEGLHSGAWLRSQHTTRLAGLIQGTHSASSSWGGGVCKVACLM